MSTQVFSFAQQSIPTGVFTLPESVMPAGVLKLSIRIARCTTATPTIWPNFSTKLSIALEVSYDNGASWVSGGAAYGMPGGIELDKAGAEIAVSNMTSGYAQPPDKIRGTLAVTGGPLVTSGSIWVN